jgi:hypothetical protein
MSKKFFECHNLISLFLRPPANEREEEVDALPICNAKFKDGRFDKNM